MSFLLLLKKKILANKKCLYYYISLFFLKNTLSRIYKFRFKKARTVDVFYFYIDPKLDHPGLVDRLKAIICCYYIACENNYRFKIVFEQPFPLADYLQPQKVDWKAEEGTLDYSIFDTKFLTYRGEFVKLKSHKQYICYNYLGKILPELEEKTNLWSKMYDELFIPSEKLQKMINDSGFAPLSYIAVHLRFVNALGSFEKGASPLSNEKQEDLIERCRMGLKRICDENKKYTILVFSDSAYFLSRINDMPVKYLSRSNIGHVKYTSDKNFVMKAFFDFMMIKGAIKVYRILSPEMYNTQFSVIAGWTGNKKMNDIIV